MTDETRAIVERIRRTIKPETITAIEVDGKEVPLSIGHLKTRWDRLGNLLDGMEWAKLKCFDGAGGIIAVVDAPDDVDAATALTSDPIAEWFQVCAAHIERMVTHVRGANKETVDTLIIAHTQATERYVELSTQVSQLQAQLMESYQSIRELMLDRVTNGETLSPKEGALLAGIGAAGERFLNLPHGWINQGTTQPPAAALPPKNGGSQ